jgi:hypothetical protein
MEYLWRLLVFLTVFICVFIAGVFIRWGMDFSVADRFAILTISVCLTIFIYVKDEITP